MGRIKNFIKANDALFGDLSSKEMQTSFNNVLNNTNRSGITSRQQSLLGMDDAGRANEVLTKRIENIDKRIGNTTDSNALARLGEEKTALSEFQRQKFQQGQDGKVNWTLGKDARKAEQEVLGKKLGDQDKDSWEAAKQMATTDAKDYFTNGGQWGMASAKRIGAGIGAYAGVNAGLRYASGGGMTYNNQGQRDIAGIPFI